MRSQSLGSSVTSELSDPTPSSLFDWKQTTIPLNGWRLNLKAFADMERPTLSIPSWTGVRLLNHYFRSDQILLSMLWAIGACSPEGAAFL